MAFIYEINGQKVEFEKEPTEKDIDEAALSLKVKPVSQQQKPVEGSGGAAFGVFRPQGRRPESQQDREASKEMPLQTARGVVTGTLGAIPDVLNLPGTIYSGVTGQEAPYKVPFGSEEWNQMLPFQSDTPQAKLARFGGEVLAPIPTIKGAKAIARAPGQVYRAGQEFTQGAMEGLRNPVYNPTSPTRSFDPLQETYYPTPQVQAFQNAPVMDRPGMLPQLEASQQPSSSLFSSPTELLATALGPKTAQGQNLIPYQGQTTKAFGETVGRDIATEPFKRAGLPSLAGATIGGLAGGPFGAILGLGAGAALNPLLRGAELFALNKLGKTAGFSRGFPEQLAEAQQLAGRTGLEASIPQTPLLPAPGPVAPTINMPGPQRNVNIEGQSYTLPNQIDVANSQTARPQPVAQTPAQQSQQLAAQKLQEVQQASTRTPQQQAILDQIRARGNNPPVPTTPVSGPVSPASIQSLPTERWTPAEKLALERANLQNNPPPTITAADEAAMAKQAIESQKATNSEIISQHAKGNIMGETTSIDTGKDAYNGSRATQGKAKALEKAGVDSLPIVNGMTDAQVIDALHTEMFGKKTKSPFTPEARTSKTINSELNALEEQMTSLRDDALESRLKPDTPEGQAYSNQLNEMGKQVTALEKELELAKKAEKKASKSAPKTLEEKVDIVKSQGEQRRNQARGKPDVLEMKIDDTPSENPDLFFSKLGQDRYKQLGPWKNEYTGANNAGNESQASRIVMDKDGTTVTQVFDSEFGLARFEGKNKNGDVWMTEYEGNGSGGKNTPLNAYTAYSDDLSILNPNNISTQRVIYKDGRAFERTGMTVDDIEMSYYNPNTKNQITFDSDGNVIESVKIGQKEVTWSDGSKTMRDDFSNVTVVKPEVDKFPNLENIIDNFEFPSKKDLGQEVKLPEKKAFDPNDPMQSFEMLTEMSPTEKRYREMSKSELKVKKQLLEQDLAKAKYQTDKDLLNNALEIVNRLLK